MPTALGFSMDKEGESHGGRRELGPRVGESDLISALPEDLLLQILVRLRCARAAARTSLLSRPWRGLWIRLPNLTFRDVTLGSLQAAFASLQSAVGPARVAQLNIYIPALPIQSLFQIEKLLFTVGVSVLLHAAARLSPTEICFAVGHMMTRQYVDMNVPRFHHAASIELHGLDLVHVDPQDSFPVLERLSLFCCRVKLAELILRCPLLRVLRVVNRFDQMSIIAVQSASLQEIHVESRLSGTYWINIEAPALKQLMMSFDVRFNSKVCVSILAPSLEKVWWRCRYNAVTTGVGIWGLWEVRLDAAESSDTQSTTLHLPHVHVMSLFAGAHHSLSFSKADLSFAVEIEKHMIIGFSVLELHLVTEGHVFGTLVLYLFRMHQICALTRSLRIFMSRSEEKRACPINCPCDEPKNWRSQTIILTNLETMEIKGFEGEDHEFDFLKLIFRCATLLKRVSVRLLDEVTISNDLCAKIYDIFKSYPFVECNIDLSPGANTHYP